MRETQRVRPSPNDDVNVTNARFLSPQGSHVLHTNLPVSQHGTHHVVPVQRSGNEVLLLACFTFVPSSGPLCFVFGHRSSV